MFLDSSFFFLSWCINPFLLLWFLASFLYIDFITVVFQGLFSLQFAYHCSLYCFILYLLHIRNINIYQCFSLVVSLYMCCFIKNIKHIIVFFIVFVYACAVSSGIKLRYIIFTCQLELRWTGSSYLSSVHLGSSVSHLDGKINARVSVCQSVWSFLWSWRSVFFLLSLAFVDRHL